METLIINRLSFDGLERCEDNLRNELLRIIYFLHGRTGTFWLIVFRVSRKNLELLTSVQDIVFFRLAPHTSAIGD